MVGPVVVVASIRVCDEVGQGPSVEVLVTDGWFPVVSGFLPDSQVVGEDAWGFGQGHTLQDQPFSNFLGRFVVPYDVGVLDGSVGVGPLMVGV